MSIPVAFSSLNRAWLLLLPVWFAFAHSASAQCDFSGITGAEDHYKIGRFEEAKSAMRPCLDKPGYASSAERTKALHLLALIALAQDSIGVARDYITRLQQLNPQYQSAPNAVFDQIFREVAASNLAVKVNSVSKRAEDIRTAPAPVLLITREEIISRGYTDLIDVLMDLPGFDISRTFSKGHANVYQMGFRQDNTQLTLLMIDGVEENDIWSNIAHLSRQYPLSGIKAIEVLYGPSSTMYGPRSFLGAINILTLAPGERAPGIWGEQKVRETPPSTFVSGQFSRGTFDTYNADLHLGVRKANYQFSITGRYYRSREDDLSFAPFYNYDPADLEGMDYSHLSLRRNPGNLPDSFNFPIQLDLNQYLQFFNLPENSPYYQVYTDPSGRVDSILLTAEGEQRARQLDRDVYSQWVNGEPNRFSNHSEDYGLFTRLSFSNFVIGVQHWRSQQSWNQYQDLYVAGTRNGSLWVPVNTTAFLKYDRDFEHISVSNFSSFHDHRLSRETVRASFLPFGSDLNGLHLAHLLQPEVSHYSWLLAGEAQHGFVNTYFYEQAKSFRNDLRIFYQSERLHMTNGIELRSSLMQGDYLLYRDYDYSRPIDQGSEAWAQEKGRVRGQEEGSNFFVVTDLGFYSQATYDLIPQRLILTTGVRMDYNQIRTNGGFGWDYSPRGVLAWKWGNWVVKGVASRGLQNVSQETKFATGGGRLPNSALETEKVTFLSLSLAGETTDRRWQWETWGFNSSVRDVTATVLLPSGFAQNRNVGAYEIMGAIGNLRYRSANGRFRTYLNYTWFNPVQKKDSTQPGVTGQRRVADIAQHHLNAGGSWQMHAGDWRVLFDLRGNLVSNRPVGPSTTAPQSEGLDGKDYIPGYLIFHGHLMLHHRAVSWLNISFMVNNILNNNIIDSNNRRYFHPGPGDASASPLNVDGTVPYIPQRPRYLMGKLIVEF